LQALCAAAWLRCPTPSFPSYFPILFLPFPPFCAFPFCASRFVPFPPQKHRPALLLSNEKKHKDMLQQAAASNLQPAMRVLLLSAAAAAMHHRPHETRERVSA
jgi:hypothetical protein